MTGSQFRIKNVVFVKYVVYKKKRCIFPYFTTFYVKFSSKPTFAKANTQKSIFSHFFSFIRVHIGETTCSQNTIHMKKCIFLVSTLSHLTFFLKNLTSCEIRAQKNIFVLIHQIMLKCCYIWLYVSNRAYNEFGIPLWWCLFVIIEISSDFSRIDPNLA